MTKKPTNLADARAMKALGAPLNTPVEHRNLPKASERTIRAVITAAGVCRDAAFAYLQKPNERRYGDLRRAHRRLGREIDRLPLPIWIERENGDRELSNPEAAVVHSIVGPRCFAAYEKWAEIIAALDAGEEVNLTLNGPDDIWPTEV